MFTSKRSIQGMDSDDSQDGSRKARSSSSDSNSSRSPRNRSSSSDTSIKEKNVDKDYGPRSPSPRGLKSPDQAISNLSTQDSENNSPNSRPSYIATGPKTPESSGSREASPVSQLSSRGPKTPASPSSPAPDSPRGPQSPQSGNTSPSSPINRSRNNWSPRSDSQSHRSRSGSVNSDRSRPHHGRPRSPDSIKSRNRSSSSSSRSSRDSSPPKRRNSVKDTATEEVSDGEMDSDQEEKRLGPRSPSEEKKPNKADLNISHEDLSDVSDLDSVGPNYDDDKAKKSPIRTVPTDTGNKELEKSKDVKVNGNFNVMTSPPLVNGSVSEPQIFEKFSQEKTSRTEDVEEQLDFEAEEGECLETPEPIRSNGDQDMDAKTDDKKKDGSKSDSELEEGEVSDEGERRPEEVEPRPICRFYSRGQCTWGINCRFLHPGVTDKGNYTMFDMVRAMPGGGGPMMHGRPPPHMHPAYREVIPSHAMPPPQPTESAWERGLRTAKEMLRLASKRREQEGAEFEDKRLHLSAAAVAGVVAPDADPDALYVSTAAVGASPPQRPTSPTAVAPHHAPSAYPHYRDAEYYGRPGYEERYAAVRGSRREGASRRTQPYFDERERFDDRLRYDERQRYEDRTKYEDRVSPNDEGHHTVKRRPRTTREVIVQRAPTAERDRERAVPSGRGDEWADPWMRGSGAGATTRNRHKRSASSRSSYSTSSSRSSRSSRGRPIKKKPAVPRARRAALSPSVIVRERRAAVARATAMNPPAPSPHRRRAPSPAAERALAAANPPPPTSASSRRKVADYGRAKPTKPTQRTKKRYSRSSSSGSDSSSSSSESDSDSRSSSSSHSSSEDRRRGGKTMPNRRAPAMGMAAAAVRVPAKSFSAANQGKKEAPDMKEISGKKRSAPSPLNNSVPAKKPVSRREELLKQLKAVEDAIARKRSKI